VTQPDRDEILSRFLDDLAVDSEAVRRYVHEYPEYAQEFYDCAILSKALSGLTPSDSELDSIRNRSLTSDELDLAARLDQYMQQETMRLSNREEALSGRYLESIVLEAKKLGTPPRALCTQLRLAMSVVAKLDRRLLDPDSVPQRLIEELAGILQRSREEVQKYLHRPPTLSSAASYRSYLAPTVQEPAAYFALAWTDLRHPVPEDADLTPADEMLASEMPPVYAAALRRYRRQSFAEAVQNAPDMSEGNRQHWLKENA